jgi:hypothetical protein
VYSSPDVSVRDRNSNNEVRTGVFFEEVPTITNGIASISVTNQGFGYIRTPIVTIRGDGSGATARAVIAGSRVVSIEILTAGANYSQATVTITPATGDTSGGFAFGVANLQGAIGTLRTYYYNNNNVKVILNPNAGTIDYEKGVVTITDFAPFAINNALGQFIISVVPDSTIISSTYNKIVAIDEFDSDSVTVTVNAQ